MKVPRRPCLSRTPSASASDAETFPIIGMGCSSFSTFFWDDDTFDAAAWTPETMDRSHPKVQDWIDTIRHCVLEHGVTLLDTAPWYGHGTSEVVIGWALETEDLKSARSSLVINTKAGRYEADPSRQFDFSYDTTIQSVERSLKRLNVDYIDVLQLHDPEFCPTFQQLFDETIPALLECKKRGYCKRLGLTGYPLSVQRQILRETWKRYDGVAVFDQSLTYGHFNLHDTSLLTSGFGSMCENHGLVLVAAAPLSMGLLTHRSPRPWHPAGTELREACKKASEICQTHGVDLPTLATVFALSDARIPCTLIGIKDISQADAAAAAANRFHSINITPSSTRAEVLKAVLTQSEYAAWEEIHDVENGPFAQLSKSGQFQWDGVDEALQFWKQVNSVEAEEWQER